MLSVQLSNALSVPVIDQVGAAGTAWLRMCFGVVFLWMIARPAIGSLHRKDVPALIALGSAEALVESGVYAARVATSFIMVSNSMGVSFPSRRCRRLRW